MNQYICYLVNAEQKDTFKANLFTCLSAIQSINLKDHYKLYDTYEDLPSQKFEEFLQQLEIG